tara:strand:+ start:1665 stop:1841 length:177 start_codon:yes stop_codon:yes gene_type:complete
MEIKINELENKIVELESKEVEYSTDFSQYKVETEDHINPPEYQDWLYRQFLSGEMIFY